MCLRGASEVQTELLADIAGDSLRSYVVWVPKSGAAEKHVEDATRVVPDRRASHFWDAPGVTIRGYTTVLRLSEDAWDIYMLYGPDAVWDGALPPAPEYWMHQLGSRTRPRVDGRYLDADVLAAEARQLLLARKM